MESIISNLQYVDKKETLFNIRWNNHRKDVKKLKVILADIHFQKMVIKLANTSREMEILGNLRKLIIFKHAVDARL